MKKLSVLFIDRSNPVVAEWLFKFTRAVSDLPVDIIFLSDRQKSKRSGNLEVINVNDVPQRLSMKTLEARYGFSLHRSLVAERSFFDYTSFRRCQAYSDLSIPKIEQIVTPYINALDYLVRERVDVVSEGLADNFMTSVAGRIAKHYGKQFYMSYGLYWWRDGMMFVDRLDQTSSHVDERYRYYLDNPDKINKPRMAELFSRKHVVQVAGGYKSSLRLKQLLARRKSYEPISWRHWVCRRLSTYASRILMRLALPFHNHPGDEDFVLFPLHVAPEATLLGSSPELADQFSLIKNISINMPFGVWLYVKQHPAQQLGAGLDYGFYRRLTALPNVRYVPPDAPIAPFLESQHCLGVAVINGTVGLEAAMRQQHCVFVFGRALYGAADCFIKPDNFDEFFIELQRRRDGKFQFNETALYSMLHALDDCVVRADTDLQSPRTWTEYAFSSIPIHREFLVKCLGRA